MAAWPYSTARWQRLRMAKLADSPLCEACKPMEIIVAADVVDHVKAINKGGDPFPPLDGLMSMCASCHNAKTNAKDARTGSTFKRAIRGYDLSGNPIDPEGWA